MIRHPGKNCPTVFMVFQETNTKRQKASHTRSEIILLKPLGEPSEILSDFSTLPNASLYLPTHSITLSFTIRSPTLISSLPFPTRPKARQPKKTFYSVPKPREKGEKKAVEDRKKLREANPHPPIPSLLPTSTTPTRAIPMTIPCPKLNFSTKRRKREGKGSQGRRRRRRKKLKRPISKFLKHLMCFQLDMALFRQVC